MEVAWSPVQGVAGYLIEVEQTQLNISLSAHLPASDTTFMVPSSLLRAGTRYHLGVATVGAAGNASYVERSFTTAK